MAVIAVFCKSLLKGGAEKQALILTSLLAGKDIDVYLINWSGKEIDTENLDFIRSNSLKYFALEGNYMTRFIRYIKFLRQEKITLIISYLTLPNFVSGISKLFVPDIVTLGGIRNENISFHKFLFERWIHNRLNDATVFNNYSAENKFIKRGFRADKIHVIHNAIDIPLSSNHFRVISDEILVVSVSRFVRQKDMPTALNAFKVLLERNKDRKLNYYIIGYGPLEKELRTMAQNLGISDHIRIMINPSDIFDILMRCDIFLSTSLFEGLSNSIMEGMVAGLPVVATDVGDNKYLVREGYNGYLVPCGDKDKLAAKMEELLLSADKRKEFGRNSFNIIKDGFTRESLLNKYLVLFSEINVK
jgi:glycosyltransferase involved in cell wall biosynthesis